jgi:hypothetical protein
MFLDRFVEDPEHTELAWLTTRALWGDLRDEADETLASAGEELSRALRRRLSAAQPATMRFVAAVSRISLRHPYAPGTDLSRRRARTNGHVGNGHTAGGLASERHLEPGSAAAIEEDADVPTLV